MHFKKNNLDWLKHLSLPVIISSRFFLIFVVSILIVGIYYLNFSHGYYNHSYADRDALVRRSDHTISVRESGHLKAWQSHEVRSELNQDSKIIHIIPQGTYINSDDVKKGHLLVQLDTSALRLEKERQKAILNDAKHFFLKSKKVLAIQISKNESDIKKGEQAIKFSQLDLEKYIGSALLKEVLTGKRTDFASWIYDPSLKGMAQLKKREFELRVDLAKEEEIRARIRLNLSKKQFEKGTLTKDLFEADTLRLKAKTMALENARDAEKLFYQYEFRKTIENLKAAFIESKKDFERIQARVNNRKEELEANLHSAQLQYDLKKRHYNFLLQQIDKCTFRSFKKGLFINGGYKAKGEKGDRLIQKGDIIKPNQLIFTISDLSAMAVDVKISESSIQYIKEGQAVIVRPDAFMERKIMGRVQKVALIPDIHKPFNEAMGKYYSAEVILHGEHPCLKPGMSASVEIIIETFPSVLVVPVQAVFEKNSDSFCYVRKNQMISIRNVVTGRSNENMIHIKKGLVEREAVLLHAPFQREK